MASWLLPPRPSAPPGGGPRLSRIHRAFTLVELLVVVAIIVILLAVGVYAFTAASKHNDVLRTRTTLQQCMSAATEYTAQTGQIIPFTGMSNPEKESIEKFVTDILQVPEARDHLMKIDRPMRIDDDNDDDIDDADPGDTGGLPPTDDFDPNYIIDAWGKPLQYRDYQDANIDAYNGTTDNLPAHGNTDNPQPFFASAGPDETFDTVDDLFSFELIGR